GSGDSSSRIPSPRSPSSPLASRSTQHPHDARTVEWPSPVRRSGQRTLELSCSSSFSLLPSTTSATQTLWLRIRIAAGRVDLLLEVLQRLRGDAEPFIDLLIRHPPVIVRPKPERLREHLRVVDRHAHLH